MSETIRTVLVVGATGSIGRLVVAEALAKGFKVRALVRDHLKAASLPAGTEVALGDLTAGETLTGVVDGIDAVIFTHGSHGGGPSVTEAVDYGGVHNILRSLSGRPVRIALMTAIGVTVHDGNYNRESGAHDWKRRAERVVRASGNVYTVVRPGWFDYNDADQHRIVMLQGDRRRAGDASDGVIARRQIAEVLVASLTSRASRRGRQDARPSNSLPSKARPSPTLSRCLRPCNPICGGTSMVCSIPQTCRSPTSRPGFSSSSRESGIAHTE